MNLIGLYIDQKIVFLCAWLGFLAFILLPWCLGVVVMFNKIFDKKK